MKKNNRALKKKEKARIREIESPKAFLKRML